MGLQEIVLYGVLGYLVVATIRIELQLSRLAKSLTDPKQKR